MWRSIGLGFCLAIFSTPTAHAAECASPLLDSHVAGVVTFFGGYSPGFVAPTGVPVADFGRYVKDLSRERASTLGRAEYAIAKSAVLDQTKADHLRRYLREAADTEIPWWLSLPASVVPAAWVGIAADALTATLDGLGASGRQNLSEAAGTVAVGGVVQALERVVRQNDGNSLLFVSLLVYQAKVGEEYRTTILKRCTSPVRVHD